MAINGITFDSRTPTAAAVRAIDGHAVTDGILSNCQITYTGGNSVTIGGGLLVVAGAVVQLVSGGESVSISGSSGAYVRVKGKIDTSRTSSASVFEQFSFTYDTASTLTGFPTLTQNDINAGSNKIYEAEICVVRIGTSGVIRKATAMPKIPFGDTLPTVGSKGEIFLLKV